MLDPGKRLPACVDLLVIGGGPTGIAAVARAARAGLRALAVEAGPGLAGGVARYPDYLVFMARAAEFAIDGLPFDCREPNQVSRDELLSYLGRVVRHRRLDVAVATRCVRLEPGAREIRCTLERAGSVQVIKARRVIVTAWYEPRPIPRALIRGAANSAVALFGEVPSDLGGTIAVLGGGISAYEAAVSFMARGARVAVLARRAGGLFRSAPFTALAAATGTRIEDGVELIALDPGAVVFRNRLGRACRLRVSGVVACFGTQWSRRNLTMVVDAGVLTRSEVARLQRARRPPGEPTLATLEQSTQDWPDLWSHLYEGRRGIHLAGGAVHIGGSTGGLVMSIRSAIECVDAITGRCERPLSRPLPRELLAWGVQFRSPALSFDDVAAVRPWPIWSWNRAAIPTITERADSGRHATRLQTCWTKQLDHPIEILDRLFRRTDGVRTVEDLARVAGLGGKRGVLHLLGQLWTNNAMTWLPRPD
jgi:thioredoxin reductase